MSKKDVISKEIEKEEKLMLLDKYTTARKKVSLINDIKGGLGVDIKANPGKANFIKKTWFQKMMIRLKKIFTRF